MLSDTYIMSLHMTYYNREMLSDTYIMSLQMTYYNREILSDINYVFAYDLL